MVLILKGKFYFKVVHKIALNSQLRFQNFSKSQGAHPPKTPLLRQND